MADKGWLTKIMAVVGTVLVWLPLAAPLLLAAASYNRERGFHLDYLMPAELFPAALAGGALLLWAGLRAQSQRRLIGWGLGIAAGLLFAGQVLAMVTGLASGRTGPGSWWMVVVAATLVIYTGALVALGVGGGRLLVDVFRPKQK
jgi:hypothetical protein